MYETTLHARKSSLPTASAQKAVIFTTATIGVIAAIAVAVSAFSAESTTSGTARAASQPQGAQVPPPASSSQASPQRPVRQEGQWLDITKVKPCGLLSPEELTEIGIGRDGREIELSAFEATGCTWSETDGIDTVVPVTSEGIEGWFEGDRTGKLTETIEIDGLPAITVQVDGYPNRCDVMVDTSAGQYLNASHSRSTKNFDANQTPCERAIQLAQGAVQTLRTVQGGR
ncbi:DUF3558 domain-containing protein [Actinosynnema pretiosum]|uniref:DUF3558 domain-containing protein n=1 Tax=Actinosynnema pretiosum TaxID=42197 RepID=A0A290Z2K0_9PSEU|nr:DUF3558 domain-containing protein [Actinosynnema pretiosum]ATE53173.1 hypothetical protein CNX65_07615 [Actinosynnema pretiosum]